MVTKKDEYSFSASAEWTKARLGIIKQKGALPETIDFSAPPEFHGEENKWTPETLLLASVAACFISTFDAIAEYSGFVFDSLSIAVEGTVARVNGKLQFTEIRIKPILEIKHETNFERALKLLEKTKQSCLISRSLSAEVILLSDVRTATAVS